MSRGGLTVLCLLLAGLFTALGVWQLDRRDWKLDLIARVNNRLAAPPVAAPPVSAWPRVNARDHEYRRVRAEGLLLTDREIRVQAVTVLGPGWWVMTPLRTETGIILINRGFEPSGHAPLAVAPAPAVVTGLLRMSEPRGAFLRNNDPDAGRWYSRDVAAIGRSKGLPVVAPFFIDADGTPNPGGYPIGGLTVVAFRNTHLIYALTWFALALLSVLGVGLALKRPPSDRPR